MDDNSLSIDLKKLRKTLPSPEIPVAPLDPTAAPPPKMAVLKPPPPSSIPSPAPAAPVVYTFAPKPKRTGIMRMLPPLSSRNMAILIGILVLLGAGYYIYVNFWSKSPFGPTGATSTAQSATASPTTSSADLTEAEIVAAVSKIMLLPTDETPTLAKVSDPAVLQNQMFFKNATVGDIVLMFPKSLRAILYDPVQNRIIEIGPITSAASTTAISTSTPH